MVNIVVVVRLIKGKQLRMKLLEVLITIYRDQNVNQHYDISLFGNYNLQYNLFILVVVFTGVITTFVPLIFR